MHTVDEADHFFGSHPRTPLIWLILDCPMGDPTPDMVLGLEGM